MSGSPPAERDRVLDPCALPTETRGRFYLLLLTALLVAWSLPGYFLEVPLFLFQIHKIPPEILDRLKPVLADGLSDLSPDDIRVLWSWTTHQPSLGGALPRTVMRSVLSLTCVGLLLTAAAGVLNARMAVGRRRSAVLAPEEVPTLLLELHELGRQLGMPRMPELRWRRGWLDGASSGTIRRATLLLAGPGHWLERTWSDLHRAVLLHEIGHLVHRDGPVRDLTRALWSVLAGLLGLVLIVRLLIGSEMATEVLALRAVGLCAAASVLWSGLVRDRELYADAWVAARGMGAALDRRLTLPESFVARRQRSRWGVARAVLARRLGGLHPTNAERRRTLRDPRTLLVLSPALAGLTGWTFALAASQLGSLAESLFLVAAIVALPFAWAGPVALAVLLGFVAVFSALFVVLTYLLTACLGIQAIRSGVAGLTGGLPAWRVYGSLLGPALAFVGGLEVGLWVFIGPPLLASGWARSAAWGVGVTLALWLWLAQAHAVGREALGCWQGREAPRRLLQLTHVYLAVQATIVTWPAIVLRLLIALADRPHRLAEMTISGIDPDRTFDELQVGGLLLTVAALGAMILSLVVWFGMLQVAAHRRPTCTACGQAALGRYVAGTPCDACGALSASWLFRRSPVDPGPEGSGDTGTGYPSLGGSVR